MNCTGNSDDHCCYLGKHGVCKHLEENTVPGRRWACELRREAGSWEKAYTDKRYAKIRAIYDEFGIKEDCGDWPGPGTHCHTCGIDG
jgi:hypothetical protein